MLKGPMASGTHPAQRAAVAMRLVPASSTVASSTA